MPLLPPVEAGPNSWGLAAVDLFAGIGGLSLGLRCAGFHVKAAVEVDSYAVEGYRANHPYAWVWHEDIREVEPDAVLEVLGLQPGALPLLAGCPPCEGFSRLRSRNGKYEIDDDRNDLVRAFQRFALSMQPAALMLENVPGLSRDGRFEELVGVLSHLNYTVNWRILDAADFGVPQRRKRLIMIASRHGPVDFPAADQGRRTVRQAFKDLPKSGDSGDPAHDATMRHGERISRLIRSVPKDGGSRLDLPAGRQLDCHTGFDGFKDVYGRMAWDDVAPTITGGCLSPSKGRFLHPEEDRVISAREAAVLQSFPSDYRIPMRRGRYAAAELIGNALPPEMIARLAGPVYRQLKEQL